MSTVDENTTSSGWDSLPEHLKKDLIFEVFKELSFVKNHIRLLILVTHGFLEMLINALAEHHLKNNKKVIKDNRSYPHSTKLLILNELEIIDDDEYLVFDWFRKLRNDAAHKPIFTVTTETVKNLNPEQFRNPANFYELCVYLIGGLWNKHISVFGPKFALGATEANIASHQEYNKHSQ